MRLANYEVLGSKDLYDNTSPLYRRYLVFFHAKPDRSKANRWVWKLPLSFLLKFERRQEKRPSSEVKKEKGCSSLPFPCSWALFSSLSLSQDHSKSQKPLPPLIVGAGLNCGLGVASNNLHSVYFSKLTVLAEFDLKVQKVSLIYIELGLALMITSLSMKVHTLSQKR